MTERRICLRECKSVSTTTHRVSGRPAEAADDCQMYREYYYYELRPASVRGHVMLAEVLDCSRFLLTMFYMQQTYATEDTRQHFFLTFELSWLQIMHVWAFENPSSHKSLARE